MDFYCFGKYLLFVLFAIVDYCLYCFLYCFCIVFCIVVCKQYCFVFFHFIIIIIISVGVTRVPFHKHVSSSSIPLFHCPFAADCVAWKSSDLFCSLLLLPIRHSHSDSVSGILWTTQLRSPSKFEPLMAKSRYVLMYDIFPKFIHF